MIFDDENVPLRHTLQSSPPGQIAIEFHDRLLPSAPRPPATEGSRPARSTRATRRARASIVQLLARCGYVQRHQSVNAEEVLFVLDWASRSTATAVEWC